MSCLTLLINDTDLRLMEDAQILAQAPGYVYQKGDVMLTGQEALRRVRLEPLHTNSQFWRQLHAQRPLIAVGSQQSAADFAYQQINSLWNEANPSGSKVAIAAPSNISAEHASLLLGIAEICPFETIALVDISVAETLGAGLRHEPEVFYHLDIHLHSSLITRVDRKADQYQRGDVQEISVGVEHLKASLMRDIATVFVQETRFDPLRSAETEQSLFNHLPVLLAEAASRGTTNATIHSADRTHQLSLSATTISNSLQKTYMPVINALKARLNAGSHLMIADRLTPWLAALEGLPENTVHQVVQLAPEHLSSGIAQAIVATSTHQTEEDGIPWVTHLPVPENHTEATNTETEATNTEVDVRPPSHLLIGTTAFDLNRVTTLGYQESEGFSTVDGELLGCIKPDLEGIYLHNGDQRLTLNDAAITNPKTTLRLGDVIKCGTHTALCIAVEAE